jgi:hypothetical protein
MNNVKDVTEIFILVELSYRLECLESIECKRTRFNEQERTRQEVWIGRGVIVVYAIFVVL